MYLPAWEQLLDLEAASKLHFLHLYVATYLDMFLVLLERHCVSHSKMSGVRSGFGAPANS